MWQKKMADKLKLKEAVVVEGRYDASRLANLIDGMIITTDGFAIYKDLAKQKLLKEIGRKNGLIVLTDSDAAGFRIRNYIQNIVGSTFVKHAYIPAIPGKEKRKTEASREGILGVEGVPDDLIYRALIQAGINHCEEKMDRLITNSDLFEWGLSGGKSSAEKRRRLLVALDLPPRMNKNAMLRVLNELYGYDNIYSMISELCELKDDCQS